MVVMLEGISLWTTTPRPPRTDADRKRVRDVSNVASVPLAGGNVRQVLRLDRVGLVRCDAFSSAVPSHASHGVQLKWSHET